MKTMKNVDIIFEREDTGNTSEVSFENIRCVQFKEKVCAKFTLLHTNNYMSIGIRGGIENFSIRKNPKTNFLWIERKKDK